MLPLKYLALFYVFTKAVISEVKHTTKDNYSVRIKKIEK